MKQIKLTDFTIEGLEESVKREKISDEEYFKNYSQFISISKLHRIAPERNGSMDKYYNPPKMKPSEALENGTMIHELTLQPESFRLAEKCGKPGGLLGLVLDEIIKNRKSGMKIDEAITKACNTVGYYTNNEKTRRNAILKKGHELLACYLKIKDYDDTYVVPSDKNYEIVESCVNNFNKNYLIQKQMHPTDDFCEPCPAFAEDCLHKHYKVSYGDKSCVLKMRGKLDHWAINPEKKCLMLNDVKTTSDAPNKEWMADGAHFQAFNYQMQFAGYFDMLESLAKKEYGYDPSTWSRKANVWAIHTRWNYSAWSFRVDEELLEKGRKSFERALKMVAYYEIFGHDEEVEFI